MDNREKALLNKIYRAVHDCVCPRCGHDMFPPTYFPKVPSTMYYSCKNYLCLFKVHSEEMARMRGIVQEWGAEAVRFFDDWRNDRLEDEEMAAEEAK